MAPTNPCGALVKSRNDFIDFIDPNEQHPNIGEALYGVSNHGAYLSVGTERAFMGAAYTRASLLWVVDLSPELVRFARINASLLRTSESLEDYVDLRQCASHDTWRRRGQADDACVARELMNPATWSWWNKFVRGSRLGFARFAVKPLSVYDPFYGFNYLFSEELYRHLRDLAVAGRIRASIVDLAKADEVEKILRLVLSTEGTLGVVDGSNVSDAAWLGAGLTARYMSQSLRYAVADTLFLNTTDYPRASSNWSYFGFTASYLRKCSTVEEISILVERAREALQVPEFGTLLDERQQLVPYARLP